MLDLVPLYGNLARCDYIVFNIEGNVHVGLLNVS